MTKTPANAYPTLKFTTCQICARAIKANTGAIAHHGYTRPHTGWQTSSCPGTHYAPYEVANDAIASTIERIELYAAKTRDECAKMVSDAPSTLEYIDRDAWGNVRVRATHERPADFNAKAAADQVKRAAFHEIRRNSAHKGSYEITFYKKYRELGVTLSGCAADIQFLTDRLKNWVKLA